MATQSNNAIARESYPPVDSFRVMSAKWYSGAKASGLPRDRMPYADETVIECSDDLRAIRKRAHVSQAHVGELLGVTQKRVSEIENRDLETMQVSTIASYLESLGATLHLVVEFPNV